MDLTFEIIDSDSGQKVEGDIIRMHDSSKIAIWDDQKKEYQIKDQITGRKTLYMHVIGTPATDIRATCHLTEAAYNIPTDPDDALSGGVMHNRRWQCLRDFFPAEDQDSILTVRQGTYTWDQAKQFVRDKVTGEYITDKDVT